MEFAVAYSDILTQSSTKKKKACKLLQYFGQKQIEVFLSPVLHPPTTTPMKQPHPDLPFSLKKGRGFTWFRDRPCDSGSLGKGREQLGTMPRVLPARK